MKHPRFIEGDEGFTLLETLVSMAIFVGVLIPSLASIGNLLVDTRTNDLRHALQLAASEIVRTSEAGDFTDVTIKVNDDYLVRRKVERSGSMIELSVRVARVNTPEKAILVLHKDVLISN